MLVVLFLNFKMETENHCQVCEREIKSKSGIIAHHGYTRPDQGWQTDSCMGARNLPYEKSRDIITKAINMIKTFIELKQTEIKNVKENSTPVPFLKNIIDSNNSIYKIRQGEYITKLEYEIKSANHEIERLQKRYTHWKLIEVLK